MKDAIIDRLLGSSKGLVLLLVLACAFAALFTGKATWDQVVELVKWTLGPWFVAVGIQGAGSAIADAHVEATKLAQTTAPSPSAPAT